MQLINQKHEAFAQEFVSNGGNASAAARAIGLMAHPASRGSDMMRRVDVQERIAELNGTLPVRLAHKVGSTTLNDLRDAVARLIALCPPEMLG